MPEPSLPPSADDASKGISNDKGDCDVMTSVHDGSGGDFIDPTVYILYGLEIAAWIGVAISVMLLWSPWS